LAEWERVEAGSDGAGGRKRPADACYPPLGDDEIASRRRAKIKNPAMAAPKIIIAGPPSRSIYASKHEPDLLLKREILVENS
jgi:hypothetical protein